VGGFRQVLSIKQLHGRELPIETRIPARILFHPYDASNLELDAFQASSKERLDGVLSKQRTLRALRRKLVHRTWSMRGGYQQKK